MFPSLFAFSARFSSSKILTASKATLFPSGLPPKVLPWEPVSRQSIIWKETISLD
ncbi:hypothetical protein ALC57_10903 [Trachymyrmex cornetzi]|uniref:Uncharacterized protein n=1 Tax=Trachymyrmex cornetzi TaxID=471704 RepID=A0A151J383_9HYME|nr:hypothetical protein ALC57_10903 [Trachymyrmex cornetzi]